MRGRELQRLREPPARSEKFGVLVWGSSPELKVNTKYTLKRPQTPCEGPAPARLPVSPRLKATT